MKMHKINIRLCLRISSFIMLAVVLFFTNCEDNDIKTDNKEVYPPDFNKESGLEYFYPDSGGMATQLVLKGYNLGTDTSYIKVTVNDKQARVIGIKNDMVYAIVAARTDTGLVKLHVGKGNDIKTFVGDKEFKYQFRRNVSTFAGVYEKTYDKEAVAVDGAYSVALFRRPWAIATDKDGAVYVLDEGRGVKKDGALRRLYQGYVETLMQCNTGPFQSPNFACFSKNDDTLFIANRRPRNDNNVLTNANVIYATRDDNFQQWKNLSVFENAETNSVAVNPVTGEVFFDSKTDGYIYRFDKTKVDNRERLVQVNNSNGTEMRMAFNPEGTVLAICVTNRHCIYKANYDIATRTLSTPVLWVGQWNSSGYQEDLGGTAKLNKPFQGVFDNEGNFFFCDRENHVIRKIDANGQTTLWAGTPKEWGNIDGLPLESKLRDPEGLGILNGGELYVTSRNGYNIRRIVVE